MRLLAIALAALVAGSDEAAASASPSESGELTYHRDVSRILRRRCESCHREGGAAPFALETWAQVARRKRMVKWAVESGAMPPWFAAEGTGPWSNDRSLTENERADLLTWIEHGAPEGDPSDAPPPREWPSGWTIGEPDLVISMGEDFRVPAEGLIDYQYFWMKTSFPEDRWVRALEVRPGAPEVVHHVLVLAAVSEEQPPVGPNEGLDGFFATTVPGQAGTVLPDGYAKRLPAGAWLKFQLHYTPNGTEQVDRTELGLVFADGPAPHEVHTASAHNNTFAIPPGAFEHEVVGEYTFDRPARLLSFFPHTHARGVAFRYELHRPDGRDELLLDVPVYDFNWQLHYQLARPLDVPAGAVLRATAWYDNTADNPANPDPTARVHFGAQIHEEMMIGYFNWTDAR